MPVQPAACERSPVAAASLAHGSADGGPLAAYRKFRYAFDGVGPRCPWYFDPSVVDPYGVCAADVSRNSAIWPTFMPGQSVIGRFCLLYTSDAADE